MNCFTSLAFLAICCAYIVILYIYDDINRIMKVNRKISTKRPVASQVRITWLYKSDEHRTVQGDWRDEWLKKSCSSGYARIRKRVLTRSWNEARSWIHQSLYE